MLTERTLGLGLTELTRRDADLADLVARLGPPPLRSRPPGFATLIQIVLEQQVSTSAALTMMTRLTSAIGPVTPPNILAVAEVGLRALGLTRQKAATIYRLAEAVQTGRLKLEALAQADDSQVRVALQEHPGIGPWTAEIYLLAALGRPDAWPVGDLALAIVLQRVKRLPSRPTATVMALLAEPWRPWRAVAARVLWLAYRE